MGKVSEAVKIGKVVKVKSICAFEHEGRLLVIQRIERETGLMTWKMPGGNVEIGETTYECAVREIREELDAEIHGVNRLGVIENIFQANGQLRHHIVFVYRAKFNDASLYTTDSLRVVEGKKEYTASWKRVSELRATRELMRPPGLLDLLDDELEPEGAARNNTLWRHRCRSTIASRK